MKTVARIVELFLAFFFALVGAVLMARGLDVETEVGPASVLPGAAHIRALTICT
jgi:hypothetical protein